MGYCPWGRKESDTTEATWHTHTRPLDNILSRVLELKSLPCGEVNCMLPSST